MAKTPLNLSAVNVAITNIRMDSNKIGVATPTVLAAVSSAASMQTKANGKWIHAATVAFKAGITVAMITEGTEAEPNPQFSQDVYDKLWDATMLGVSAGKGELKFSEPNPFATGAEQLGTAKKKEFHRWTVAQVLALDKAALRLVTDPIFRKMRKEFQANVGTMMNQLRRYVDRLENPDKERAAKPEKNKKSAAEKDLPMLDKMAALLQDFNAQVLALKDTEGKTLPNVLEMHEAGLHLAALIGQNRKTK
jgi:hypothetical protein